MLEPSSENPIPLDLTREDFQRYVAKGVDPKDIHAVMHDATLILPRLVEEANRVAKSAPKTERMMRHYLIDCAERVLPIFETRYPENHGMRLCLETGRLLADGKIDEEAAREILIDFVKSFEPSQMSEPAMTAATSAFLAVG